MVGKGSIAADICKVLIAIGSQLIMQGRAKTVQGVEINILQIICYIDHMQPRGCIWPGRYSVRLNEPLS